MKLSKLGKKGQVMNTLAQLGVGIVALTLVLTVTFLIMSESEEQIGSVEGVTCLNNHSVGDTAGLGGGNSAACNATHTLQDAVSDIPGWVPIIVITVIGAALIGLVALFRGQGGGF